MTGERGVLDTRLLMSDKRRTERFEVDCQVKVTRDGRSLAGHTRNLSLGGALVQVDLRGEPPWTMGEEFDLTFSLPDLDQPVSVRAKVRWVRALDPESAGVQFLTGFRAREAWALNRLFSRSSASPGA